MTTYRLTLDYDLPDGWLAPYLQGLRDGQAMGWHCAACGAVSFPPARVCICGSSRGEWTRLDGRADILVRTSGSDGAFALARFHGAYGAAAVRLADLPDGAAVGALIASTEPLPQLCVSGVRKEERR